ncbi:MAG: D-hexose-6-phosphate mutarotase [Alloacidobacterium sp.]
MNRRFAIEGVAEIVAGQGNLPMVHIHIGAAEADIYLHGAQVTSWRPADTEEVIFLSRQSRFEEGKAIRGGIPVCFPWFRAKADNPQAPAHGVVRTKAWQLDSLERKHDSVIVTLSTESDEETRRWWPHEFRLVHRITVGADLTLELVVVNSGSTSLRFEEALHTYHHVGDAEGIRVGGLDGAPFLDNTDANREKTQHGDIVMTQPTDNAYLNTRNTLELVDPILHRRIRIEKEKSLSTVVWNPWESGAKALADLGDDEWRQFACVEASNIMSCAVTLGAGEQHTMTAKITTGPS